MVGRKLDRVGPLDGVDKVTLALILHESVDLWAVKHWHIRRTDLVRAPLTRFDDVLDLNVREVEAPPAVLSR